MSTKATIVHGNDFHFYEECFEDDAVYLSIHPEEWSFDGSDVTIKLDLNTIKKIVDAFIKHRFYKTSNIE